MRALHGAALGLLLCSSAAADASVLLVDSPFDQDGVRQPTRIYAVDLANGDLTLAADLGDTYTAVLGLAAANGTVLYATGSDNSTDPDLKCFGCVLLQIVLAPPSTTPASITPIGRVTSNGTTVASLTALSFRGNGDLYAVSEATDVLYRIDPQTAAATEVGPLTVDVGGGCSTIPLDITGGDLVFDGLDRLWVWSNTPPSRGLWEVNPSNACAVNLVTCPFSRNLTGLVVEDRTSANPVMRGPSPQDERLYRVVPGVCPMNGEPSSLPLTYNGAAFDHARGDLDAPYCEDDASCEDGDACTSDLCSPGGCQHGAVTCNDGNPCTDDACDPGTGCLSVANTAPCDDADPCTEGDRCEAGVCAGSPVVVAEVQGLTVQEGPTGAAQLSWASQGLGLTYDVVRGSLTKPGGMATSACLESGLAEAQWLDALTDPFEGEGFFYVVRAASACVVGSYGTNSIGQERHSPDDCP